MTTRDLVRFQFGAADAIRAVAASRAALPTGVLLVLLTAVARSYDQTWIGENPFLWLLGPLLFSLVSGTWLFFIVYAGFVRANWAGDDKFRSVWRDWPAFMGLFWMTAPIAWLYAIPVERFLDDVPAAKANVALLATVSLWRVLLFSRVVQVISGVKFLMALVWVLLAACIETCVIVFFTTFGDAIARGMGGLRNSPAEDVVLGAVSFAAGAAFWVGLVALGVSLAWRPRRGGVPALGLSPPAGVSLAWRPEQPTRRLGPRQPGRIPWPGLAPVAAFWLLAALWVQPAVQRSARAERLVQDGEYRAALDFLAAHRPEDFAPSRPLPPKAYEWQTFPQLAGMLEASADDKPPAWVRDHLKRRLDEMLHSLLGRKHLPPSQDLPLAQQVSQIRESFSGWQYRSENMLRVFETVLAVPWLADWRERHRAFLIALATELKGFEEVDKALAAKLESAGFLLPSTEGNSPSSPVPTPAP